MRYRILVYYIREMSSASLIEILKRDLESFGVDGGRLILIGRISTVAYFPAYIAIPLGQGRTFCAPSKPPDCPLSSYHNR